MLDTLKFLAFLFLFLRFAYWIGSSFGISQKQSGRILSAQASEGILLFFFFSQLFGHILILPMPQNFFFEIFGFFVVCFGISIMVAAKKQLGKAWVYAAAYRIVPRQKLLTSGVFALVRHPIYVGVVMSYVGIELLAGSYLWIAMLFFFIPFYQQAKKEEALLLGHFGKKYAVYQKKTCMFVPGVF